MKKTYLVALTIFSAVQFSHAQWTTNGSNTTTTNNVGIGTTNPGQPLDIESSSSLSVLAKSALASGFSQFLTYNDQGANVALHTAVFGSAYPGTLFGTPLANRAALYADGSNLLGMALGTNAAIPLTIGTNGAAAMTILPGGYVGIGTTSPGNLLQINSGGTPAISQFRVTANGTGGVSMLTYSAGNSALTFDNDLSGGGWVARNTTAFQLYNLYGTLRFTADYSLTSGSSYTPTTRMILSSNGNVGIGTTGPDRSLVVSGTTGGGAGDNAFHGTLRLDDANPLAADNGGGVTFGYTYSGSTQTYGPFIRGYKSTATTGEVGGGLKFGVRGDSGSPFTAMTIDKLGNIGIGTATPQEALSVNGNIRSRQVKVETANWPDYVFKKEYSLMPLAVVKTYIDVNHHLPEIPSEKEIARDGQNLGEMNKVLVKKVEELTMYLIEKDKESKAQEERIKAMETKLNQLLKSTH